MNLNDLTQEQIKQGYSTIPGAFNPLTGQLKTPVSNVINLETIKATTPLPLPQTTASTTPTPTQSITTDLLSQYDLSQKEKEAKGFQDTGMNQYLKDIVGLQGEAQTKADELAKTDFAKSRSELVNVENKFRQLEAEKAQDDVTLVANMRAEERKDTLLPFAQMGQAKLAGDAQIVRALKTSEQNMLNARALALQGNIELAKQTADDAVAIKYAPYKERIKAYEDVVKALEPYLSSAEKKEVAKQTMKGTLAMKEIEKEENNEKNLQNMLITASSQGAPVDLVSRAQKAKTPSEAAMILGQYAGDFYKTELLKQSIETEKAQRAKIYADLAKTNAETNAANAFAKLPTNQKIQANIASGKIQPGQLFSLSTGEIPKNISADKVDGLLALKDLAKKTKEYNDVFTRFEEEALLGGAGLATGLKNVPFPSGTKTALDGLRSEITDLLARARSGAALTAYETAEYEKKLPSSFNSSLGLGKQGTDKIKALQSSLDSTLNTKLQGYGVTFAEGIEDDYLDTVESSLKNLGTQGLNFSGYAASLTQ